ncbi:MAG TPA: hypothetical protein VEF76_11400, partial [Patescibacteria group bacterium]|nr:hypothetical protein [Patescibacteria group bacterium]
MSKSPQKDRLIQNALIASREGKGVKKENQLLHEFLSAFYQQVPPDDLQGWKAEDLSRVATSMCEWAAERASGQLKVRVFNPELKRDGWHIPHTVVEIVNDDMPFIIDSVASDLGAQGYGIDVLFHPILTVSRDGAKLKSVQAGKGAEGKLVESCVYIQLEQMLTTDAMRKLQASLEATLGDVRAATSDWRKMLAKIDEVSQFGDAVAKNHDRHDVQEAQDFLSYIKNNNFTLLGFRAYNVAGGKASLVSGSGLGILKGNRVIDIGADAESRLIEGLRESRWPAMVGKLVSEISTVHRRVPLDVVIVKKLNAKGELEGMSAFVGLFTSSTYSCRTSEIPMVRQKVAETIERAGFTRGSHDYKALEHILEKMPRD